MDAKIKGYKYQRGGIFFYDPEDVILQYNRNAARNSPAREYVQKLLDTTAQLGEAINQQKHALSNMTMGRPSDTPSGNIIVKDRASKYVNKALNPTIGQGKQLRNLVKVKF